MQCKNSLFQQQCEKAIQKLGLSEIENFKAAESDEGRIKVMYNIAREIPITLKDRRKSRKEAQGNKEEGNLHFAQKNYHNALKTYSCGIIRCPQDEVSDRELLSILISNRSATFFELKQYENALKDIEYLSNVGSYPKQLMYKVSFRKAKCYDALGDKDLAESAYNKTREYLQFAKLDNAVTSRKIEEIMKLSKESRQAEVKQTEELKTATSSFPKNDVYVAAHRTLTFNEDTTQGRFACAVDNIPAGTTIMEENPHCAVLVSDKSFSNCQSCLTSTNQPFACPTCANVVFCSWNCLQNGNNSFHKMECPIQPSIFELGASINCSMALRIVTQKPLKYFLDVKGILDNKRDISLKKKKKYTSEDYCNVYHLCLHDGQWKKEHLIHYTCMTVYLLRLLKTTNYFEKATDDAVLEDTETYIGSLMLRHLQLLQFNAHEISELSNIVCSTGKEISYRSEHIGGGLYPTLSLFNHSCDPTIIRYNVGNKMVVRTIKPIKSGDIIYENYGPLYTNSCKEERQMFLKERYWFECLCKPCVELWPQLDQMDANVLRIRCKHPKCPKVFVVSKDVECPFLTCKICKEVTSIFPYLKGLMDLEKLLPDAEESYVSGCYEKATDIFLQAINIYCKYSAPPFPELIKVQQRLRSCMVHAGNMCIDYKDPSKLQ